MDLSGKVAIVTGSVWTADAIASIWPDRFAASLQRVGQEFPEPPQ